MCPNYGHINITAVLNHKPQENEYSESDTDTDNEESSELIAETLKRKKGKRNLEFVFPSRRTINRYLEDAS